MSPPGHFQVTDNQQLPGQTPVKKVWVNFLPNIDLGHVITMISFLAAIGAQWNIMDRKITIVEQRSAQQDAQVVEIKADLKEIKGAMLQIQLTLARQDSNRSK